MFVCFEVDFCCVAQAALEPVASEVSLLQTSE